jgi:transcriptional regulator of acetoin/glycerol metabolism
VRELKNALEAMVLSGANGNPIDASGAAPFLSGEANGGGLRGRIADLERDEIERAMKACDGNRTRAARALGISRKTLWQKLKQIDPS